jgi:O-antigen ligase
MNRLALIPAAAGAAFALPLAGAMMVLSMGDRFMFALAGLPVAVLIGAQILAQPFVGVALLILVSQIDALVAMLFRDLPGIKLLTAVTVGAALLHLGYRKPRVVRVDPTVAFAIIFMMAILVSTAFANELGRALDGTRRLFSMAVLFFLVVAFVDTERKVRIALICILASTAISGGIIVLDSQAGASVIAAQAAFEAGGEAFRSRGATQGDATTAASILLAGAGLGAMLALRARGTLRTVALAAALLGIAGMLFSFTRSATLVAGLGAAWIAWRHRRSPVVVAGVAAAGLALIVLLPAVLWERLAALFGQDHDFTLFRRLGYHVIGLQLLAEHPLFGIGPRNFSQYYMDFDNRWVPGRTLTPRVMHNMYLAIAVEIGLVGAAAFIAMLASGFARCLTAVRTTTSRALAGYGEATLFGFALLLIVSATLPNETNKYVWIYAGLTVAIARVAAAERAGAGSEREEER